MRVYRDAKKRRYCDKETGHPFEAIGDRPPKAGEFFLRPTSNENEWVVDRAITDFYGQCFIIIKA